MNNYINILLISGSGILAGLINYAYHPIMLQFLTLEEFGTFGSLIGIFNLLGVLLVGLDFFFTKKFSKNVSDIPKVKHTFFSSLRLLSFIGMLTYIIFILLTPIFSNFLKIESSTLFLITGLVLLSGFIGVSIGALLKSMKAFKIIALQQILGPFGKLGIGLILVIFGFGVHGALLGFVLSAFIPLGIGFFYLTKKLLPYKIENSEINLKKELYKEKKELSQFFIMSFIFAFFMNIDVILAKNIFSAELSGTYAAISVLGKFLIFLLLSIETVYFGQIMECSKKQLPKNLIFNPLILISITIVSALIFNMFLGKYILHILKPGLEGYVHIFILGLIFYGCLAYISFFLKVLTGWKIYTLNYLLIVMIPLSLGIIYTFGNNSLLGFTQSFVILGIIMTLISGSIFGYYWKYKN